MMTAGVNCVPVECLVLAECRDCRVWGDSTRCKKEQTWLAVSRGDDGWCCRRKQGSLMRLEESGADDGGGVSMNDDAS